MDKDLMKLLVNGIVKNYTLFDIYLNEQKEVYCVKVNYSYKSPINRIYDYTNKLIISNKGLQVTFDLKKMELPTFLYKVLDVYPIEVDGVGLIRYKAEYFNTSLEELLNVFAIAKKRIDTKMEKINSKIY